MPTNQGSIRLFRLAKIDVFLHWTWFLVAVYEINIGKGRYSSPVWMVAEYLALFLIVTLHEFGHALACRQVGGRANRIVLWPLGGVAYVDPPPRPGATLWSIAAGPLVNVVLFPVLVGLYVMSRTAGHDLGELAWSVMWIDGMLLAFNILPIYPLDGGQILRSLLWFILGRARSLMVATVLGFVGLIGFFALAAFLQSVWLAVLGVFMLLNCWSGLKSARAMMKMAKAPRHDGFSCPRCKAAPPVGDHWVCPHCKQSFDTFQTNATCPNCHAQFPVTRCSECGALSPMQEWIGSGAARIGSEQRVGSSE